MSRHPSSTVAPFSILVPVVGIGASWLMLGEPAHAAELLCGAVVVAGVLPGTTSRSVAPGGVRRGPSRERASSRRQAVGDPLPAIRVADGHHA